MRTRVLFVKVIFAVCTVCLYDPALAANLDVRLVDATGKPLTDAVIFVPAPAATQPTAKRALVVQRARVFEPFVTVVEKGSAIDFPNEDSMLHNVYSFSPAKRFELKLYKGVPSAPVVFDAPGVVVLGCSVHDWMQAYIAVVDTPFFAKTSAEGKARITNLPAGTHELMVWYPGMPKPIRAQQVELRADDPKQIEHKLDVRQKSRPRAPPLNPHQY